MIQFKLFLLCITCHLSLISCISLYIYSFSEVILGFCFQRYGFVYFSEEVDIQTIVEVRGIILYLF